MKPTEAEQLAGADALIEFGRWLAIYGKTAGICTCCAEKLIEALANYHKGEES